MLIRDVFLAAVVALFVILALLAVFTGRRLFRRLARTHRALPLATVLCFAAIVLPSGSYAPEQGRLLIGAPLTIHEGPDYRQYIFERWGVTLKDDTAQWSREEIKLVYEVLYNIERRVGQVAYVCTICEMRSAWEGLTLRRMHRTNNPFGNMAWVPPGYSGRYIEIPDGGPDNGLWEDEVWTKHILAEEFGHAWDFRLSMGGGWNGGQLSGDMESYVDADASRCLTLLICATDDASSPYDPGDEKPVSEHAASSPSEDWGGAFAQYVEPLTNQELGPKRQAYVRSRLDKLDDPFWTP